jgi:hypothetical protein
VAAYQNTIYKAARIPITIKEPIVNAVLVLNMDDSTSITPSVSFFGFARLIKTITATRIRNT